MSNFDIWCQYFNLFLTPPATIMKQFGGDSVSTEKAHVSTEKASVSAEKASVSTEHVRISKEKIDFYGEATCLYGEEVTLVGHHKEKSSLTMLIIK